MKTFKGKVLSLKMQKTAIVEVQRRTVHPLYKKVLSRAKKYKADTNGLTLQIGDVVKMVETRPISKDKNFKIEGVIK